MGDTSFWRVSKIIKKDIHILDFYAVYVHSSCWSLDGIIWAQKIGTEAELLERSKQKESQNVNQESIDSMVADQEL